MGSNQNLEVLQNYLLRIPAVHAPIGTGHLANGNWWVKFRIDIHHPLAWQVVQELGHVLNDISLEAALPVAFLPVSPPPYLNGGPDEFLSWVIQSKNADFTPAQCAEWLIGRLPRPVEELEQWTHDDHD